MRWEHHPSHFWLVLLVAVVNATLGLSMNETARRRGDPRIFLVGLAFLAAAGFLGLHALATPGVLLEKGNAGFTIATQVGLVNAAVLAVACYVGSEAQRSFAVIGDTTNTAARLQAAAQPGEVVIAAATREAIGEDAEVEAMAPVEAKGKRDPVPAFRLVRLSGR